MTRKSLIGWMVLWLVAFGTGAFMASCSTASTNAFRLQQTSENIAYTGYIAWTNYLAMHPVDPATSNAVKEARLKFAASDRLVDSLRAAFDTNSAVAPQLNALLNTLSDEASNILWTIEYLKSKQP